MRVSVMLVSGVMNPPTMVAASGPLTNEFHACVVPPPVAPVAPVAPAAPVAPGAPGVPGVPVAPVAPVAPVEPVAPVSPVAPVAPVAPVGPAIPAGPSLGHVFGPLVAMFSGLKAYEVPSQVIVSMVLGPAMKPTELKLRKTPPEIVIGPPFPIRAKALKAARPPCTSTPPP